MKIHNILFISFFLVSALLVPAGNVFAAVCSSSCTTIANSCTCGGTDIAPNRSYCFEGRIFDKVADPAAQANCQAFAAQLSEIPENFKLPEAPFVSGGALLQKIDTITNWVFAIFLAISIIYILIAAFQFVTGGGKPEEISSARQKLIYAAIGIAIALLAKGIPVVIRNIVTGPGI